MSRPHRFSYKPVTLEPLEPRLPFDAAAFSTFASPAELNQALIEESKEGVTQFGRPFTHFDNLCTAMYVFPLTTREMTAAANGRVYSVSTTDNTAVLRIYDGGDSAIRTLLSETELNGLLIGPSEISIQSRFLAVHDGRLTLVSQTGYDRCQSGFGGNVLITEFDVSNDAAPQRLHQSRYVGSLLGASETNGRLTLVLSGQVKLGVNFSRLDPPPPRPIPVGNEAVGLPPNAVWETEAEYDHRWSALLAEQGAPGLLVLNPDGTESNLSLIDFENFHVEDPEEIRNLVSVLTLDQNADQVTLVSAQTIAPHFSQSPRDATIEAGRVLVPLLDSVSGEMQILSFGIDGLGIIFPPQPAGVTQFSWQNLRPGLRADIDENGTIDAQDVLWAVWELNRRSPGELPAAAGAGRKIDVNGDNQFDASDILTAIVELERAQAAQTAGEANDSALVLLIGDLNAETIRKRNRNGE